jgi:hypothetical protein
MTSISNLMVPIVLAHRPDAPLHSESSAGYGNGRLACYRLGDPEFAMAGSGSPFLMSTKYGIKVLRESAA